MSIQQAIASSSSLNWFASATFPSSQFPYTGAAIDAEGNFYSIVFDSGATYFAVVKLNPLGVYQWTSTAVLRPDASTFFNVTKLTVDTSGNIYGAGSFGVRLFVCKWDSSGGYVWGYLFSEDGGGNNPAYGLTCDSSGNIYVATGASGSQAGIFKLNSSGSLLWNVQFAGATSASDKYTRAYSLALDSSGNVYVCGSARDFANNNYAGYLAKYNSSGVLQWKRRFYTSATVVTANSVTVDSNDNVFVGVVISGVATSFILKYNTSGVLQGNVFYNTTDPSSTNLASIAAGPGYVYTVSSGSTISAFTSELTPLWANYCLRDGRTLYNSDPFLSVLAPNNFYIYTLNDATYGAFQGILPTNGTKTGSYSVGAYTNTYTATAITTTSVSFTEEAATLTPLTATFTITPVTTTTTYPALSSTTAVYV